MGAPTLLRARVGLPRSLTNVEAPVAKILVCDDDQGIRDLLAVTLELDHEVFLAVNGRDALDQLLGGVEVDVVVLDAMMPELDGIQTLRELRAHPDLADIAVVMLSARVSQGDVELGFEAGADDYVTKPFDPADLEAAVERVLAASVDDRRAERARDARERATELTRQVR